MFKNKTMNSNAGVNLDKLQKRFDEFFANETPETFWAFVEKKRKESQQPIPQDYYWQKRCEAAETLLEIVLDFPMTPGLGSSNKEEHRLAYNNWQQLKSYPSPTPVQDGLKHVNLFLGDLQAKTDRILRDKGASNKDVSDAINDVVLELSKKYSIIRKSAEAVQEGLRGIKIVKIDFAGIVLENSRGDQFFSGNEALIDFLHYESTNQEGLREDEKENQGN